MTLKKEDIAKAVADPNWQQFRAGLKGLPTEEKLTQLDSWQKGHGFSHDANVQVENYKNALARAGQLPPPPEPEKKG
jgi:hypothetical protein